MKGEIDMGVPGVKKPPASQTVDEALEAESANKYALRHWQRAMADGVITVNEAREGVRLQEKALQEARDVVPLAEKACQFVTLGSQFALHGPDGLSGRAVANAATVGVYPPTFDDEPEAA